MGVVFDNVTGSVEPEAGSVTEEEEKKPPATEEGEMKFRYLLCRLKEREARLRAD